jgi:hypothetical protein
MSRLKDENCNTLIINELFGGQIANMFALNSLIEFLMPKEDL